MSFAHIFPRSYFAEESPPLAYEDYLAWLAEFLMPDEISEYQTRYPARFYYMSCTSAFLELLKV